MNDPTKSRIEEPPEYWTIIWGQFRRNRIGLAALYTIVGIVAVALYTPLFASRVPLFWSDASGVSFPLFHALLFNRNVYENGVDIFFNLLLVLSPVYAASRAVLTRSSRGLPTPRRASRFSTFNSVWLAFVLATFVVLVSIDPRTAVPDYRALAGTEGIASIFPPVRIHYDDTLFGVTGPGILHLLGQDGAGRDIFVRLLYGTRVSIAVGVIAVSIYITLGTTLGALAGYFGRRWDLIISRAIEIFLCFPSFFLILTFVGFLDQPSIAWVMLIIGFIGWTGPARLVRAEFLRLKNLDFVTAARASGFTDQRIIFRHLMPNALGPILVTATFGVASSVLVESSLSFLGFGDPTLPSWGRILSYGRDTSDEPMMLIAGAAIFVTVSAFNLAGEGLRDALDPRLRK